MTEDDAFNFTGSLASRGYVITGQFLVSNGAIIGTGADGVKAIFDQSTDYGLLTQHIYREIDFNVDSQNGIFVSDTYDAHPGPVPTANSHEGYLPGFDSANYKLFVGTPVPEPSQYALFIVLAAAGLVGWRRFSQRVV